MKRMKQMTTLAMVVLVATSASAQLADIPMEKGKFDANTKSLEQWECPEWFQDAKFGLWAHWGPQCQANSGDWFGRYMYGGETYHDYQRDGDFKSKEYGFKEYCRDWKAEKWDPEAIVAKYEKVGAKYFMALANHHDNFDCWDSPYQEWNSKNMGPMRDLGGEWAAAARRHGMKFGMSVHAAHAWTWFEIGRKYGDVRLTKADGAGKWWEGYDPNELYAQAHETISTGWDNMGNIHSQWNWGNGASIPDEQYKTKLQNRCRQMVDALQPDVVYFDDTVLPFYGCDNQWGQDFLAYYYNHMSNLNGGGNPNVVACGKVLTDDHKGYMLWDVERGIPDRPQKKPWQTDTCIGGWHYSLPDYWNGAYKSAATVIRMLIDIVSKNGNLLLSVPLKGDGTYDEKEAAILDGIQAWMEINGESIYGTRVWDVAFGEGPLAEAANGLNGQGFNEGQNYTSQDVRYVHRNDTVYATIMAWPSAGDYAMKTFSTLGDTYPGIVESVELLGYGAVSFTQDVRGLVVNVPSEKPNEIAPAFRIRMKADTRSTYERIDASIEALKQVITDAKDDIHALNTGKINATSVATLEAALAGIKVSASSNEEELAAASRAIERAYAKYNSTKYNRGGALIDEKVEDLTKTYLLQASAFKRAEGGTARFGKPANWTVENFKIPNGSDGTKQGLDKYSGKEALMLGVWNDAEKNAEGDLKNARIYRKIHLPKGDYFFGAAFNACYQLSDNAYMFVATELMNTEDIPTKAIAFYNLNKCSDKLTTQGLCFSVPEEMDVYVGFQANLLNGSSTQEFRAESVSLYSIKVNRGESVLKPAGNWTLLEAQMPDDVADYFYALYDTKTELGMKLAQGSHQGNPTMVYTAVINPNTDKGAVWAMEGFDNNNNCRATGDDCSRVIFTNLEKPTQMVHSEDDNWWYRISNNCEGWTDRGYMTPEYSINDADWTFRNYKGGAYLGPWDETFTDGSDVAGNKSGSSIGHFTIYAITRGDYMAQNEKLEEATEKKPVNVSYLLRNAEATMKNNFHSDYPVGWTTSHEGDVKIELGTSLAFSTDKNVFSMTQSSGKLSDRFISQRLKGLPNGFYRVGIRTNCKKEGAYLFANENEVALKDYSVYKISVDVEVTDGNLELGVKLVDFQSNSCKFDAFSLNYMGTTMEPDAIKELTSTTTASPLFDLNGRRLSHHQRGVNVKKGKKVLVR